MTKSGSERWARRVGIALGLGLALLAVLSWRIPASERTRGADVEFLSSPPGQLGSSTAGSVLKARALRPGGEPARSTLRLHNVSGEAVEVRVRAVSSSRVLDRLLRIELTASGATLRSGWLAELRRFGGRPLALSSNSGHYRQLALRAWLPRSVGPGWDGQIIEVALEYDVRPVER
jgi:hypothetical protein